MKLNEKACDYDTWYDESRKHWITIDTIQKLKPGKKVKLLLLDRNVLDGVSKKFKAGKIYSAAKYFNHNTAVFWKTDDQNLGGKLKYKWQENSKGHQDPYDFEFDVEYTKGSWYPMCDGVLPAVDPQGFAKLSGKAMKWTEFPKTTHIGWRGPMILWSNVKHLPKIYFT